MSTVIPMIGHNNPPEPTPFELAKEKVDTVCMEARHWLDGAAVNDEKTAGSVSNLLNLLRDAEKKAEAARKEEKQPYLDAGRTIDAKYKELTDQVELAVGACKKALQPWLIAQEAKKKEEAERARREADEKARAAQEALRATAAESLVEKEKAEALYKEAKKAEKVALSAAKETAKADGGIGRAVSLRTEYVPVLTDEKAAARHYWTTDKHSFLDLLKTLASRDVRMGKREIPGFEIKEEKRAV